jgi:hypothetical protein
MAKKKMTEKQKASAKKVLDNITKKAKPGKREKSKSKAPKQDIAKLAKGSKCIKAPKMKKAFDYEPWQIKLLGVDLRR